MRSCPFCEGTDLHLCPQRRAEVVTGNALPVVTSEMRDRYRRWCRLHFDTRGAMAYVDPADDAVVQLDVVCQYVETESSSLRAQVERLTRERNEAIADSMRQREYREKLAVVYRRDYEEETRTCDICLEDTIVRVLDEQRAKLDEYAGQVERLTRTCDLAQKQRDEARANAERLEQECDNLRCDLVTQTAPIIPLEAKVERLTREWKDQNATIGVLVREAIALGLIKPSDETTGAGLTRILREQRARLDEQAAEIVRLKARSPATEPATAPSTPAAPAEEPMQLPRLEAWLADHILPDAWKSGLRISARADLADARALNQQRIRELSEEVDACLKMAERNGEQRDRLAAELATYLLHLSP
jgi:hypothetical protein